MPWKRTSSVIAATLVMGLGLTACGGDGSDSKDDAAKPPATTAPESPASDAPTTEAPASEAPAGDTSLPQDLPEGLPLPTGRLTSVTGGKGAYVLTYTVDDQASALDSYRKALEGKGYTVVEIAGTVTATKGTDAVSVAGTGTTLVVTVSS
ncbi:hypothetical protein [Streptomyces sp. NPDC093105]|uniref:hypothetical protein n=1 Tax=Streptomyces sp. NPDC093105 TaxID=3366029 RepID=UPI00380438CE